jgi:hypothetical protein
MDNRKTDIMQNLERNLVETVAFFKSLSPEDLSVRVYQEDTDWTIKLVLAHFVTIERTMHWLFKNILSGGPGSPKDFDIERFNRTQPKKLDGLSLDELIRQFEAVRSNTILIVKDMSEKDLDREGWHVFHGHDKLERFIRWAYEHVNLHAADIRKVIGGTDNVN